MGNVKNVKSAYSFSEWQARESYYIDQIANMSIATQPTSTDIKTLTAEIDSLLSEALLDLAYIERTNQKYQNKYKNAKEELFLTVKQSARDKVTEADVKSMLVDYLRKNPLNGDKQSILDILDAVEGRYIYIKRVVEVLKEKKAALVTDNGMLKLEAGIQ